VKPELLAQITSAGGNDFPLDSWTIRDMWYTPRHWSYERHIRYLRRYYRTLRPLVSMTNLSPVNNVVLDNFLHQSGVLGAEVLGIMAGMTPELSGG
jgi:hypothetical protein